MTDIRPVHISSSVLDLKLPTERFGYTLDFDILELDVRIALQNILTGVFFGIGRVLGVPAYDIVQVISKLIVIDAGVENDGCVELSC